MAISPTRLGQQAMPAIVSSPPKMNVNLRGDNTTGLNSQLSRQENNTDTFKIRDPLGMGSVSLPVEKSSGDQQDEVKEGGKPGKAGGKGKAKGKGKNKEGKKIPPGLAKKNPADLPAGNPWKAVLEQREAEQAKQQGQQPAPAGTQQRVVTQPAPQLAQPQQQPAIPVQQVQAPQPVGTPIPLGQAQQPAGVVQQVVPAQPQLSKAQQAALTQQFINGVQNQATLSLLNAPNRGGNFGVVSALGEQVGLAKALAGI